MHSKIKNPQRVTLKKVLISELGILKSISIQTYTDQFEKDNNPEDFSQYVDQAFSNENLLSQLHNIDSTFYFVYHQDVRVGYIKLNSGKAQTELRETTGIEIERIYILSDFQGREIGSTVLTKIFDIALKKKMDYIWLGVWEHNKAAIRFYKHHGFRTFGSHDFMMGSDKQCDILMKRIL